MYQRTPKFLAMMARYRGTEKGRIAAQRGSVKRRIRTCAAAIVEAIDRLAILQFDNLCHLCDL
jgi:hypothetical protein